MKLYTFYQLDVVLEINKNFKACSILNNEVVINMLKTADDSWLWNMCILLSKSKWH